MLKVTYCEKKKVQNLVQSIKDLNICWQVKLIMYPR